MMLIFNIVMLLLFVFVKLIFGLWIIIRLFRALFSEKKITFTAKTQFLILHSSFIIKSYFCRQKLTTAYGHPFHPTNTP